MEGDEGGLWEVLVWDLGILGWVEWVVCGV